MNIKSLLLGSAAALFAVSGARAADAVEVVAEPEPMEYVRICDTYGAQFYYIPGTETCLRVGGFVRYQVSFGNEWRMNGVIDDNDTPFDEDDIFNGTGGEASDYGWQKLARASIQLDARTETELGTLRSYIDARIDTGPVGTGAFLEHAFISLGGVTIGHTSNAFDYDLGGEQDILGDGIFNVIQYTWASDSGLSFTVSIDDDGDVISGANAFDNSDAEDAWGDDAESGADFIPNVSANIQYASGPIAVGLYGAYDNDTEEGVVKALASYSFSDNDKLSLGGYWASGHTYVFGGADDDTSNITSGVAPGGRYYRSGFAASGEWSVQGEYWHRFNEKLAASVAGVYVSNVNHYDDQDGIGDDDGLDFWRVGTTIDYTIVPGFNIKTSVNYNQYTGSAVDALDDAFAGDDDVSEGFVNGFIRFQRDF